MLSGRWWSSTRGSLGLGPQNPSRGSQLCALYAFTYTGTDGRQVSLAEGDRFLLLRKTNSDWWLARRLGAPPTSRPIFVPAAYMTEESIPSRSPSTISPSQSLWTPGEYSLHLLTSLASRNYWKDLSPSEHLLTPFSYFPPISLLFIPIAVSPFPLLLVLHFLGLMYFSTASPALVFLVNPQDEGSSQDHPSDPLPLLFPFLCFQGQSCVMAPRRNCMCLRNLQAGRRPSLGSLLLFPPKCVEASVLPI